MGSPQNRLQMITYMQKGQITQNNNMKEYHNNRIGERNVSHQLTVTPFIQVVLLLTAGIKVIFPKVTSPKLQQPSYD